MNALALLLLLAGPPAHGEVACADPASVASFIEAAREGEAAFADLDLVALTRARKDALEKVPCLAEPVTPEVAAAFHRMMALAAFTSGDEDAVLREFHAARRLEPGYRIPEAVAPEGHPLVALYERSIDADEGSLETIYPPAGGWVSVDGIRGAPRPNGISTILQSFTADQALERTLYLLPGEPTPAFGPPPVEGVRRERRRVALTTSAGTALATAGVLYGLAWASNDRFWDTEDPVPDGDLAMWRARTNALLVASGSVSAVGLGLGVAVALAW